MSHDTKRWKAALTISALLAGMSGQAIADRPPDDAAARFSAVSIKPDIVARPGMRLVNFRPGGRLTADGVSVRQLAIAAYGLPPGSSRLGKSAAWTESEKYVVEAVAESGTIRSDLSGAQLRQKMQIMLQRLLQERFKLVIRREPKEMPVLALVTAASGAKLTKAPVTGADCETRPAGADNECHRFADECSSFTGCRADAVTMADLAFKLEVWTDGRPVVDRTGVEGLFSVQLRKFTRLRPLQIPDFIAALPPESQPKLPAPGPSLFKVLEQDLGLQLQPARAQIEVLTIESVERPSGN